MLSFSAALPRRTQLQDLILTGLAALDGDSGPYKHDLRTLVKQLLLLEARLAALAVECLTKRQQLTPEEDAILANPYGWTYEPQVEICCTKCDDGPGVSFAFSNEVVLVPTPTKLRKLATGRYWVERNGQRQLFEDRLDAITAADDFLSTRGIVFGAALQREFRSRLQHCIATLHVA